MWAPRQVIVFVPDQIGYDLLFHPQGRVLPPQAPPPPWRGPHTANSQIREGGEASRPVQVSYLSSRLRHVHAQTIMAPQKSSLAFWSGRLVAVFLTAVGERGERCPHHGHAEPYLKYIRKLTFLP